MRTSAAPIGHRFDPAALAQELEGEIDFVHRALRRQGVDAADADDLVQDVFVVAWRRRDHFEADRPLRAWLAGIAYRVARRHLRRRGREVIVADLDAEDHGPAPEEALVHRRARRLVLRAFAELSPEQRALIEMHDLDGVRMKEIAREVGVPLFTAYTRLRRARLRLAARVESLQSGSGAQLTAQPLSAEELLAIERTPPAAPERVHARARVRLRALAAAPVTPWWPGTTTPWRWAAAGVSVAGLAALVSVLTPAFALRGQVAAANPTAPTGPTARVERAIAPSPPSVRRLPTFLTNSAISSWPPPALLAPSPAGLASLGVGLTTRLGFGSGTIGLGGDTDETQPCRFHGLDLDANRVPGPVDAAIGLRGGWIECPAPAERVLPTTEVSAAAWVKLRSAPPRHVSIVARQLAAGTDDYFFFGLNRGKLKVRSDLWKAMAVVHRPLPFDRWQHVAFTRSADGTIRLFVDGVVEATRRGRPDDARQAPVTVSNPLAIGAGINGPGVSLVRERLDAAIDEVVVYDRALSNEEVAALAEGAVPDR